MAWCLTKGVARLVHRSGIDEVFVLIAQRAWLGTLNSVANASGIIFRSQSRRLKNTFRKVKKITIIANETAAISRMRTILKPLPFDLVMKRFGVT